MTMALSSGFFLFAGLWLGYHRVHPFWVAVPVAAWIGLALLGDVA